MLLSFTCRVKTEHGIERWDGIIPRIDNHGSHYEIRTESRSGIMWLYSAKLHMEALPACQITMPVATLVI